MKRIFKKSQSITEYAVVIACTIAVLTVMQAYFRRGLSGKIKQAVDNNLGLQFDPQEGVYKSVLSQKGDTVEVNRLEKKVNGEDIGWYNISYSVTGPQSYVDGDEEIVIEEDDSRKPSQAASYQTSEIPWKKLGEE